MVEFTTDPIAGKQRLKRTCRRCKHLKWRVQFESLYAKRCIDCSNKLRRQAKCQNCGRPTGLWDNRVPRKYCTRPECQEARFRNVGAVVGKVHHERYLKTKSKVCKPCGRRLPLTEEYFTIARRDADGNILLFHWYCRSCTAAEQADKYATDSKFREQVKERVRRHKERSRQRMLVDPVYAEQQRARKRKANAKYREQQKLRAQRDEPKQVPPAPNSGPELPADPLMRAIDAWREHEGLIEEAAAERLGITVRRFWSWRRPGARTRMSIADKCLLGLDMLWWEIWDPVVYPEVAEIWEGPC